MKNRFISLLLCLCMLLSTAAPVSVYADEGMSAQEGTQTEEEAASDEQPLNDEYPVRTIAEGGIELMGRLSEEAALRVDGEAGFVQSDVEKALADAKAEKQPFALLTATCRILLIEAGGDVQPQGEYTLTFCGLTVREGDAVVIYREAAADETRENLELQNDRLVQVYSKEHNNLSIDAKGHPCIVTEALGSFHICVQFALPETDETAVETEGEAVTETEPEHDDSSAEEGDTAEQAASSAAPEAVTVGPWTVSVSAGEGVLPEGTGLSVAEIPEEELKRYVESIENDLNESRAFMRKEVLVRFALDISLIDKDGKPFEPNEPVSLTISNNSEWMNRSASDTPEQSSLAVYHISVGEDGACAADHLKTSDQTAVETAGIAFSTSGLSPFLGVETRDLLTREVEVSTYAEFKQAILEAEEYVTTLPEGEAAEQLTITLLADILLEEFLAPDNYGCVRILPGEDLYIRSAEGEKYSITVPSSVPNPNHAMFSLCTGNSALTVQNVVIKVRGCGAIRSEPVADDYDYSNDPRSTLNIYDCDFVNVVNTQVSRLINLSNCNCTIRGWKGTPPTSAYLVVVDIGSLSISDCIFENARVQGNVVYANKCSVMMDNCTISGFNRIAESVFAVKTFFSIPIRMRESTVEIKNCHFIGNRGYSGGVFFGARSTGTITDTEFLNTVCELPGKDGDGGGAFRIQNDSHFTLNNCVFKNNYSDLSGGAILVYIGSTLTINGGEISNNTAVTHGGAITVADAFSSAVSEQTVSKVVLNGVKVSENVAQGVLMDSELHVSDPFSQGGGALYAHGNCEIVLKGGTTITGNRALNGSNGGGVFVCYAGVLTVDGASITGNTASGNGGGVYLDGAGTYEGCIHGAWQADITTDDGFGSGSNMLFKNGLISGNCAVKGGGIYINGNNVANGTEYTGGTLVMEQSVVTANRASSYGGGIYMSAAESGETGSSFLMKDGALYFNVSGADGNMDGSGAGADLYAEGGNTKVSVRSAEQITNYIQNASSAYVPAQDRAAWFTNWYDDFSASRYMAEAVLDRNIYSPVKNDEANLALILDRTTSLRVTKLVKGPSAPRDKEFEFELSISNLPRDEDYPVVITSAGCAAESVQAFTDGKASFKLKAGESFTISQLPAGTAFTIRETENHHSENLMVTGSHVEALNAEAWTVSGATRSTWNGGAEETAVSELTLVNLYDSVLTINGRKTWDDDNDRDGMRPLRITIRLLADGECVGSKTVTASDGWSWSFSAPRYKEDGTEIVYTIAEDAVSGYTARYDGYDVTNKHTPETITVSGQKTWEDNNNRDGLRPGKITIRLFANGEEAASKEVTESDDWAWSFANLPKYADGREIVYSIREDPVEGYEARVEGYHVTNRHVSSVLVIDPLVRKQITGDKPNTDGSFRFKFRRLDTAFPMPVNKLGSTDAGGPIVSQTADELVLEIKGAKSVEIGEITFTKAGEYYYEISEINRGEAGYSYDKTVYWICFTVREEAESAALVCEKVVIRLGDAKGKLYYEGPWKKDLEFLFTNTYKTPTPDDEKPRDPMLPQTGQHWMPLLMLGGLGFALLAIGYMNMKRKSREKN